MLNQKSQIALITIILTLCSVSIFAQTIDEPLKLKEKNLSGPRLGITYVSGDGEAYQSLKDNNMGRFISQFGWHFEYQVSPKVFEGPAFVVQYIPLIGGVEYGKFVPSQTLAFGIRFPNGIEFGMGPNLVITDRGVTSSLVLAGGKSFDYGGVSIPLNLAYAISPKGNRVSFVFGYALD